ncbi:MAG: 1-acyl-sn-glycerol-3-phosphate acyltransferase [Elusimicrobiota bacterium]
MKNLATFLIRIFLKVFYKIEVVGIENVPPKGKIIIASNHISNIDPPAILSFINKVRNDTVVLAKKELFKNKLFGKFLKNMGAIEVDRQNPGITPIKKSIEALNQEKCLLIFPQGTRKKQDNEPQPKHGISYLVKKTGANVLPVKIFNKKNGSKLGKIIIVFDKPIDTKVYDFSDNQFFERFPQLIMDKILSINKE